MKFKFWSMAAVLALSLPNAAWAWEQECEPQFDSFAQVMAAAKKGNAEAQYWLGEAYFDGESQFEQPSAVDYGQARAWYDKAVAQNMKAAKSWFEKAAAQGDEEAAAELADWSE